VRPPVDTAAIRLLIRQKLQDGRLPYNGIPRFWGGPSEAEQCDACEREVTDQLVMEGLGSSVSGRKSIQMHVDCFALWDEERREAPK
jgi:hypothetical protein